MDRQALVLRNRRLAASLRKETPKQRLRDVILAGLARLPVTSSGAGSGRLLIIRPDHLGDVLLCTPAIQAIKRQNPRLSIHVLCGSWSAEALARYSEIDRVLTLDFPGFQGQGKRAGGAWWLAWKTARQLRAIGYSSAIIMRPDHWWGAMVARLAGIEKRVGYDLKNVKSFLSLAYPFQHEHAVVQNMRLATDRRGQIAPDEIVLRYPLLAADQVQLKETLRLWRAPAGLSLICIHPGSGRQSKLWRTEKWAAVADQIVERYAAQIVFTGTASETGMIDEIVQQMTTGGAIVAGPTSISQLAALYNHALAVLGPDSGALHLAAAAGTATVALFGPADPSEFAPWGDRSRHAVVTSDIGCRPCRILDWRDDDLDWHPCVRDITIEEVLSGLDKVLSADRSPPAT